MKAKVKLDVDAIKKWLLAHGEKVALGVMVLVFLSFTFFAAKREVLDDSKQPDKLSAKAAEVDQHVSGSAWDQQREGIQVIDFDKRAARETVEVKLFTTNTPFHQPLADPKTKRDDPQVFKIEELRVASGFGTFAMRGDGAMSAAAAPQAEKAATPGKPAGGGMDALRKASAGGRSGSQAVVVSGPASKGATGIRPTASAKLQAQPWAVITGLIPIEKQQKEYARVFERALGGKPERDTPHYMRGARVMRAEIVGDAEPAEADYKPVTKAEVFEAQFETFAPEVVAPEYVDPGLTGNLGPLVGATWGESVAHPKIPLAAARELQAKASPAEEPAAESPSEKPAEAANDFAPVTPQASKAQAAAIDAAAHKSLSAPPPPNPYRLLRIFDYSVEPKKKYKYKITVAIENPNYGVAARYLLNPGEKEQPQIRLIECDPTEAVTIPDGNGVLAGGVTPLKSDPSAKLMLTAIDKETGIEASSEVVFFRGAVANKTKEARAIDPRTGTVTNISNVDFASGMVVLDMIGGKKLSTKNPLMSPCDVLLLDPSGKLVVHSELDDMAMYESRKPPEESDKRREKDALPIDKPKGSPIKTLRGATKTGR